MFTTVGGRGEGTALSLTSMLEAFMPFAVYFIKDCPQQQEEEQYE